MLPEPYGFSFRLHSGSLPSWRPLSPRGTQYHLKTKSVGFWTRYVMLKIRSFPFVLVSLLRTVICHSVGYDRRLSSPQISNHKGFTSATFNLISHGLEAEYECISAHEFHLCDSERKTARGVDDSRRWKAVSRHTILLSWNKILWHMLLLRHWQTMINKQTFTQCDISRSLALSLLIPLGCLSSTSRGEWSRTEHDRNTVKADGFMSQSFAQQWILPALRRLQIWDVIISDYFWATSASPSLLQETVPNIYYQPSVNYVNSSCNTIKWD